MRKKCCIFQAVSFLITVGLFLPFSPINGRAESLSRELRHLERSFSLDASLTTLGRNGISASNLPSAFLPDETEIRNAAQLLTTDYAANRLYLIYRKEMTIADAERVFELWRQFCSAGVEVVPVLALHPSNNPHEELFSSAEIKALARFFKRQINPTRLAVAGLKGESDDGAGFQFLASEFKTGLLFFGMQPEAKPAAPFSGGVLEIKQALSQGESNEQWQQSGFGLERLRKCVIAGNERAFPVAWTLAVTTGDYNGSGSGADDDAQHYMPLPSWRNTLAAREVVQAAQPASLSGFNVDLHLLHVGSQTVTHDGSGYSFYEMLKQGHVYVGFYARPFHEVVRIYSSLRSVRVPEVPR
jgi:hypothetical protein